MYQNNTKKRCGYFNFFFSQVFTNAAVSLTPVPFFSRWAVFCCLKQPPSSFLCCCCSGCFVSTRSKCFFFLLRREGYYHFFFDSHFLPPPLPKVLTIRGKKNNLLLLLLLLFFFSALPVAAHWWIVVTVQVAVARNSCNETRFCLVLLISSGQVKRWLFLCVSTFFLPLKKKRIVLIFAVDVKQFKKPHILFLFVYGFFSFICNYVDDEQRKHKKKKSENGKIVSAREVVCPFFISVFVSVCLPCSFVENGSETVPRRWWLSTSGFIFLNESCWRLCVRVFLSLSFWCSERVRDAPSIW